MLIDYYSFKTNQLVNQNVKKILVIESNERTIDQRSNFILNNFDLKRLILKKVMQLNNWKSSLKKLNCQLVEVN